MDYFVACLSLVVPVLLLFACVADGRSVTVEHDETACVGNTTK